MQAWASATGDGTAWVWCRCASEPRSRAAGSNFSRAAGAEPWSDSPSRQPGRKRMPPAKRDDGIAVMLVDDHLLVRRGFRRMLEDDPGIRVVAEAGDGPEAVELAERERPDV